MGWLPLLSVIAVFILWPMESDARPSGDAQPSTTHPVADDEPSAATAKA